MVCPRHACCSGLDTNFISAVACYLQNKTFGPNEYIFYADEVVDRMHVLCTGRVRAADPEPRSPT